MGVPEGFAACGSSAQLIRARVLGLWLENLGVPSCHKASAVSWSKSVYHGNCLGMHFFGLVELDFLVFHTRTKDIYLCMRLIIFLSVLRC
uniref:Uncharacterized protein n=1 Tax=Arundo donax TaxID=35708 RepID=A0A0A9HVK6_ARUDO